MWLRPWTARQMAPAFGNFQGLKQGVIGALGEAAIVQTAYLPEGEKGQKALDVYSMGISGSKYMNFPLIYGLFIDIRQKCL